MVRRIFERLIALGSITVLSNELRAEGITTKSWTTIKGGFKSEVQQRYDASVAAS